LNLPRDILDAEAPTSLDGGPRLLDATQKLRVMLESILEPVLFRCEPDQDAGRPTMAGYDDLLAGRELEVSRKIILHLRQGHAARLG